MSIQLIKPQEVVNGGIVRAAPTTVQFDPALLYVHVQPAEGEFFKKIVGADMYLDMIQKQNTAVSNYNPDLGAIVKKFNGIDAQSVAYETLWTSYALSLIAFGVLHKAMPFIALTPGSNGIFANEIEHGRNQSVKGTQYLQNEAMTTILNYQKDMLDFICANATDYPLFDEKRNCRTCGDEKTSVETTENVGGMFFGDGYLIDQQPRKKWGVW